MYRVDIHPYEGNDVSRDFPDIVSAETYYDSAVSDPGNGFVALGQYDSGYDTYSLIRTHAGPVEFADESEHPAPAGWDYVQRFCRLTQKF